MLFRACISGVFITAVFAVSNVQAAPLFTETTNTDAAAETAQLTLVDEVVSKQSYLAYDYDGAVRNLNDLVISEPSLIAIPAYQGDLYSLTQPFFLRALPSEYSVVLINGKRRHRSAVIDFENGMSSQRNDISFIPQIAVKSISVNPSDMTARYGANAVAGVIDFELKEASEGSEISLHYGQYDVGDGGQAVLEANQGIDLSGAGFANFSLRYQTAELTSRGRQHPDAASLLEQGNSFIPVPARQWGSAGIDDDVTLFVNSGVELEDGKSIYAFGHIAQRESSGTFGYRHPQQAEGVYSSDNGNMLLVGDMAEAIEQPRTCPVVPMPINADDTVGNILSSSAYLDMVTRPQCFSINSLYPGGFSPNYGTFMEDSSLTFGSRGLFDTGFVEALVGVEFDVSAYLGKNKVRYHVSNSLNPSLGMDSPTAFNLGQYIQSESAINVDFNYSDLMLFGQTVKIRAGGELRNDKFELIEGDVSASEQGPYKDQGFAFGSQGMIGVNNQQAGSLERSTLSFYSGFDWFYRDIFTLQGTIRNDQFTDVENQFSYQVSAELFASESLIFKASHSRGYRMAGVSKSLTSVTRSVLLEGNVQALSQYPSGNLVADSFSVASLTPEQSIDYRFGVEVLQDNFSFRADGYFIELSDRMLPTQPLALTETLKDQFQGDGIDNLQNLDYLTFVVNDFRSETSGLDVTTGGYFDMLGGEFSLHANMHWHETLVTDSGQYLSEQQQALIERGIPQHQANIQVAQEWSLATLAVRASWFDEYVAHLQQMPEVSSEGEAMTSVDVDLRFSLSDNLSLSVGGKNILNQSPQMIDSTLNPTGALYYDNSPLSINGRYYYVSGRYRL